MKPASIFFALSAVLIVGPSTAVAAPGRADPAAKPAQPAPAARPAKPARGPEARPGLPPLAQPAVSPLPGAATATPSLMPGVPTPPSANALTLAEAVRYAKRHNLQLKASRLDVRSARVTRKLGWALLGPHFSFGVDFSFIGGDSAFDSSSLGGSMTFDQATIAAICNDAQDSAACLTWMANNGEYAGLLLGSAFSSMGSIGDIFNADTVKFSIGAAWQVLNWDSLLNVKRFKLTYKLSRANVQNTQQDVVTNVTLAYYGVLAAADVVGIIKLTSRATKEHLRQARALMAAGMGTQVDVLRWQAQVASDQQKLLEAEQGVRSSKIALNNLMGRRLNAPLALVRPAALSAEHLPPPKTVREPLRTHPQLRLSRLNVRLKKVDYQGSQAAFLPTVTVSGGYNWQHFLPYESVTEGTGWLGSWAVMLSIKVPLFDSMTKVYDMQIKELAVAKARLEQHNLVRFLRQQVLTADLEVKKSYTNIAVAKKQVKLAEEAHRSAENLYRAGNAKTTDVLDAQNGLLSARFNLLNARFSYLMALAKRARAVGNLP